MKKTKINNIELGNEIEEDKRPILHGKLIENPNFISIIIGKKGGGKSTLCQQLLKICALINNPGCNLFIFSKSYTSDKIMALIKGTYEKYKYVNIQFYNDIIIDGVGIINEIIDTILENQKGEKSEVNKQGKKKKDDIIELMNGDDEGNESILKDRSKLKFRSAENIFIIDDLGDKIRKPEYKQTLTRLFTINRHINGIVFLLCHKYSLLWPVLRSNSN